MDEPVTARMIGRSTAAVKLSVVTTLYQSANYVADFYQRISCAALAMTADYELIFVNDGSPDDSLERTVALYEQDPRVRIVDLSRNFGHHKAMMTGLRHVRGDLVFLLDVDLEEQPEWLLEFRNVMEQTGADVVYGVQRRRKGNLFERCTGAIFYKSFNALLQHPIPANLVTARLMTRRYVKSLVQHRERDDDGAVVGHHRLSPGGGEHRQSLQRHNDLQHSAANCRLRRQRDVLQQPAARLHLLSRLRDRGAIGCLRRRADLEGAAREVGVAGWPTLSCRSGFSVALRFSASV